MRIHIALVFIMVLIVVGGCDSENGPFSMETIDILAGSWNGTLDYSISGGVTTPMTLAFTDEGDGWLSVIMSTGSVIYTDNLVAEVNDKIVMNFDVAGETWELVLEGDLVDSTHFGGEIIRREAGINDITLGTFEASPS